MKKLFLVLLLLGLAAGIALAGGQPDKKAGAAEPEFVLKWNEPEPMGHPWADTGKMICEEVYKRSNGRIKIDHYPAGTLGGQPEAVEMLRMGSLFMLTSGPSILNAFNEDVQIFSVPYLFRDREHAYKAFKMPWVQHLFNEDVLEKSGVRTIAFWYYGDRNVTTKNVQAYKPEDLAGVKIRCMNIPVWKTVVASLGANPTPVAYAELYMALQTGVAQGQENPFTTVVSQKFYEVQNYIIETRHVVHMGTIHVSEQIWQKLPEADRTMILEVFDEYLPVMDELMDKKTEEAIAFLKEKGVTIIEPDREAFKEHATREFMKVYGDKWGDIIKEIQAVR